MIAAQKSRSAASYLSKKAEAQIENQRTQMKQFLKKLNPNVDIVYPKCLEIKKLAVEIDEYAELRKFGQRAEDLPEPADPMTMQARQSDYDIEATNWLLNEGYKSRAAGMLPKKQKKKHP